MKQDAYVIAPETLQSRWLDFLSTLIATGKERGNDFKKWPKETMEMLFTKFEQTIDAASKPKSFFELIKTFNSELIRSGYDGLDQMGLSAKDFSKLLQEMNNGPSSIESFAEAERFQMLVNEKWISIYKKKDTK